MDGTLYVGERAIPGAPEFVAELDHRGIPYVFLTNNSSRARGFYHRRLRRLGFDVTQDRVLTSSVATARFLLSERPGKRVYAIGTPDFLREMREAGVELTDSDPDIVLLAFDTSITYEKINRGYRFVEAGCELVATHPDDLCPAEGGYDVDIGPFIRLFESLTGVRALVVGKPNRLMLEMAASEMGASPEGTVMVGDRLYTDIRMAADAGSPSVLVLTGEASAADLERPGPRPTAVAGSVADVPGLLDSGALGPLRVREEGRDKSRVRRRL